MAKQTPSAKQSANQAAVPLPTVPSAAQAEEIRAWRKLVREQARLANLIDGDTGENVVGRYNKVKANADDLRKEIGATFDGSCFGVVDNLPFIYQRGEQANPFDKRYEVAWLELAEWLAKCTVPMHPSVVREKMESVLPEPTPTIVHKLT